MIKVFHARRSITRDSLCYGMADIYSTQTAVENFTADKYEHVANIDSDDLDQAYFLTQHIGAPGWQSNDGVTVIDSEYGKRSTSVGDIMIDSTGRRAIVGPIGFDFLPSTTDEMKAEARTIIEAMPLSDVTMWHNGNGHCMTTGFQTFVSRPFMNDDRPGCENRPFNITLRARKNRDTGRMTFKFGRGAANITQAEAEMLINSYTGAQS